MLIGQKVASQNEMAAYEKKKSPNRSISCSQRTQIKGTVNWLDGSYSIESQTNTKSGCESDQEIPQTHGLDLDINGMAFSLENLQDVDLSQIQIPGLDIASILNMAQMSPESLEKETGLKFEQDPNKDVAFTIRRDTWSNEVDYHALSPIKSYEEIDEKVKKSIGRVLVPISNRTKMGTGFLISENTLVTNYHVIRQAFENPSINIRVELNRKQTSRIKANVVLVDTIRDIAVLNLDTNVAPPYLEIGSSQESSVFKRNTPVFTIGYPKDRLSFSSGGVFDITSHSDFMAVTALTKKGASGSPLISRRTGKVVGVVTRVGDEYTLASYIEHLKNLLRQGQEQGDIEISQASLH